MTIEYRNNKIGKITDNAQQVLESRYFLKDEKGRITEEFADLCNRVANAIGKTDDEKEAFFDLMFSLDFLPNTPTLVNAGTKKGTLSACFVLPIYDTMESITKASHDQAMVQKFGGGTGFGLSRIRPKGSPVSTTHGIAMGPVGVLEYLSATSKMVTEGGIRDGANMAVLSVHHPDIMEFITCKQEEGKIHNFNISVGLTDEFMEALDKDTDYNLYFRPLDSDNEDQLIKVGTKNAREVWDAIIDGAWRNGEPGAIFLDEVNRRHPADFVGDIEATNPCGEQPLLENESCNLGSINVSNFVLNNYTVDLKEFDNGRHGIQYGEFDFERFETAVRAAVRFLDRTIDANRYATKDIKWANQHTRKIGLGIMGFADALVKMGIQYGSRQSLDFADDLATMLAGVAEDESVILSEETEVFPAYADYADMLEDHPTSPRRNACLTTIAPTGSISMIAGCSSGIEPLFALAWRKQNILHGQSLEYVHPLFEELEIDYVIEEVINGADYQTHEDSSAVGRYLFKTTTDLTPQQHVDMQAAFQRYIDAAVSKTINLPNSATREDVDNAYRRAHRKFCKGITVYRAGSREKEVLVSNTEADTGAETNDRVGQTEQAAVQDVLEGKTVRFETGRGKVYITLNRGGKNNDLKEVFITHGRAGGNDAAMAEALSRLISVSLQDGTTPTRIIKQLQGITDTPVWSNGRKILSLPDAVAQAIGDETGNHIVTIQDEIKLEGSVRDTEFGKVLACPDCGWYTLGQEEGCVKCHHCGYSKC